LVLAECCLLVLRHRWIAAGSIVEVSIEQALLAAVIDALVAVIVKKVCSDCRYTD